MEGSPTRRACQADDKGNAGLYHAPPPIPRDHTKFITAQRETSDMAIQRMTP
jgi:hypothetical protein